MEKESAWLAVGLTEDNIFTVYGTPEAAFASANDFDLETARRYSLKVSELYVWVPAEKRDKRLKFPILYKIQSLDEFHERLRACDW